MLCAKAVGAIGMANDKLHDENQRTSVGRERELSRRNRRVRCGRKVGARGRDA